MANYIARKHVILASDPTVTYKAGAVFAGAALNGETSLEQVNLFLADANGQRTGTPINIEPHTAISGLSEI